MIDLWGRKNAYNVQKVLWALDELELEYRHHDVGSLSGELTTPEYLAINPHARIPTIRDKNGVVWESNSIIRYLGSEYGGSENDDNDLWPQNAYDRSCAERWMDWELTKLQPDFINLFWGYYRKPEAQRNLPEIEASLLACQAHFGLLDDHLSRFPYLSGEHFTLGDIPCATGLYRYFSMGLEVDKPKHVMRWYKNLSEREPFNRNIAVAFDELKGRVDF